MGAIPKPDDFPPSVPHQPSREGAAHHNHFQLIPLGAQNVPSSRPYVVKGLIYEGSTVLIYGATQAGKSFLALDLILSVGFGIPWLGHQTSQGLAVYVASEGSSGIPIRVAGWQAEHGLTGTPGAFQLIGGDFNLMDAGHTVDLIAKILTKARDEKATPKLVIIDTLSSAIPGEDENNQATMSTVMQHVRRIAEKTGAAVGLVHHVSKADSKSPRGNSVLPAGMDTSLLVKDSSGCHTMEIVKQRDGATGEKIIFDLAERSVELDHGQSTTTCVPRVPPAASDVEEEPDPPDGKLLAVVHELARKSATESDRYDAESNGAVEISVDIGDVRSDAYADIYQGRRTPDAKRKAFDRDLDKLVGARKIQRKGKTVAVSISPEMLR